MKEGKHITLLYKKLTGMINATEKEALESWLDADEQNQQTAKSFEKDLQLTEMYKNDFQPDVEAGLSRLKKRIQADAEPKVTPLKPRRWLLRVAAAAVLMIGIAGFLYNHFNSQPTQIIASTWSGEQKQLTLPDGSTVWLNENSHLTYPASFSNAERSIQLEGEAFFEVAHKPDQPFRITAIDTDIRVLGTSFNVLALKDNPLREIQVKTGKVQVNSKGSSQQWVLEANDFLRIDRTNKSFKKEKDNTLNAIAWHSKTLSFKDTPIHQVIADLERHFKIEIQLTDPSVNNCTFTSLFNDDDISSILTALCTSINMRQHQLSSNTYQLIGGSCSDAK